MAYFRFRQALDKLQAEVTELRAQLANKHAEFEALWNETDVLLEIGALRLASCFPEG